MSKDITLAFDVYGTLIDTNGVVQLLKKFVKSEAKSFAMTWRDKQLEYSFRRAAMKNYVDFATCTAQALDYTCLFYKEDLSTDEKKQLLEIYKVLPAFDEVKSAITSFKNRGFRLFAFSNGKKQAVENLLINAGIKELFIDVVSVDDLKTFKPNPLVYEHFISLASANKDKTWLISSNPFDVTGAINAGLNSAWIKRSDEAIFDPWEIKPSMIASSLSELTTKL